jgi:hypothetical protein
VVMMFLYGILVFTFAAIRFQKTTR